MGLGMLGTIIMKIEGPSFNPEAPQPESLPVRNVFRKTKRSTCTALATELPTGTKERYPASDLPVGNYFCRVPVYIMRLKDIKLNTKYVDNPHVFYKGHIRTS